MVHRDCLVDVHQYVHITVFGACRIPKARDMADERSLGIWRDATGSV